MVPLLSTEEGDLSPLSSADGDLDLFGEEGDFVFFRLLMEILLRFSL